VTKCVFIPSEVEESLNEGKVSAFRDTKHRTRRCSISSRRTSDARVDFVIQSTRGHAICLANSCTGRNAICPQLLWH